MTERVQMRSPMGGAGAVMVPPHLVDTYTANGWVAVKSAPEPALEPAKDEKPKPVKRPPRKRS